MTSRTRLLMIVAPLVALGACAGDGSDPRDGTDAATTATTATTASDTSDTSDTADEVDAAEPPWTFETLEERAHAALDRTWRVELVRATRPDGAYTYIVYVHALADHAPAVVLNEPYAGIDWTGEDVDARWAALGDGIHPDVDAPDYDGDDVIGYAFEPVERAADAGVVWLLNGFATIRVYGRFYAGGSLADDALDAAAGYHFAAARADELDLSRLGGFGVSWGGMMTLFGAARAPEAARPRALAAVAPPSDFATFATWTDETLPSEYPDGARVAAFYSPYWRRVAVAIGRHPADDPRSAPFRVPGLCSELGGDVLVMHDEWDALVPVTQTQALVAGCPSVVAPLYYRRAGPTDYAVVGLDHGPLINEPVFPSVYTFGMLHVIDRLLPSGTPRTVIAHQGAIAAFLATVHDAQARGLAPDDALDPLRLLAAAGTTLFDPSDSTLHDGGTVTADAINAVWGTTYDAAGVRAALALGLPPAP